MTRQIVVFGLAGVFFFSASVVFATDRHVPSEYPTIQAAIDDCNDGDVVIVEPNTYTGTGNKEIDFKGKAITVESQTGPENCIIDCENSGRGFCFHSGEDTSSILSGFTIKRGKISGSNAKGGGIYCTGSSPTIENCVITNNTASGNVAQNAYGGGIYCTSNSNPTIINCTVSNNKAQAAPPGNAYGGGIYCSDNSHVTIEDCNIADNTAIGAGHEYPEGFAYGGGIYGGVTMSNSAIISNAAVGDDLFGMAFGGGIYGTGTITNCSVIANTANINCTQSNGGGVCSRATSTIITNCILWANTAIWEPQIYRTAATSVSYSDVQGGCPGTNNINADPCFVSGPYGDYYLSQKAAGQTVDSPCVGTGSDTSANLGMDIYTTRADHVSDKGIVDMGYHYPHSFDPDISGDFHINFIDFGTFADYWLFCSDPCDPNAIPGDMSRDGCVDTNDLGVLSDFWLGCFVTAAIHPSPANGAAIYVDSLSWLPGEGVLSHDVYLGTDFNDVNGATPSSPEYVGNQTANSYDPNGLEYLSTYYWRIDEISSCDMLNGEIWSFTTTGEPNSYLVGWWKFDEGSGTDANDSSGNANHGTLNGDPNWVAGKIGGYALDFDGVDDYVGVPSDPTLNVQYITMSAWVKVDNAAPSVNNFILNRKMAIAGTYALYLKDSDSKWSALIRLDGSESTSRSIDSDNVATTDWTHICGTYDGDKLKLYIDAVLQTDVDDTDGTIDNDIPRILTIAAHPDLTQYFDGTIDEVCIYNRALTAGEIQQLYQSGL